jgi:hypothetical protein
MKSRPSRALPCWTVDPGLLALAPYRAIQPISGDYPLNISIGRASFRVSGQAAPRFFLFANGDGALPALIAAHRFRAASAIAFRPAALSRRLWRTGVLVDGGCAPSDRVERLAWVVEVADVRPLPGGRPRRLLPVLPPRASIARFNFSRSAISNARIWSVGIEVILSIRIQDGHVRSICS